MNRITEKITKTAVMLFALCLTSGAWAAVPTATAVWEGNFDVPQNGYSITLPSGMTYSKGTTGNIVIGSTAKTGAIIELDETVDCKVSVLIKYSHLYAVAGKKVSLATVKDSAGNVIGIRSTANNALTTTGFHNGNDTDYGFVDGQRAQTGSGYLLFSYDPNDGTFAYTGRTINSLSGGKNGTLRWGGKYIDKLSIGGPVASGKTEAWAGVVIEKVALFVGNAYTNENIADYAFPSQTRWHDTDTYAYRGASSGSYFHLSNLEPVDCFDTLEGDTITLDASIDSYHWKKFASNQGATYYKAPGCALFYDKTECTAQADCTFGPLSFGGLYVTSEQTTGVNPVYYSIIGSGERNTELGDPDGKTETYFVFDKSFTIRRSGNKTVATKLYGVMNVSIASGMTFDLNSQPYDVSHSSIKSVLTTAGTTAPVLKMSGGGKFKVYELDASIGTLDFSGVTATPFIEGDLKVTKDTKLVLPAGIAEGDSYVICSGTLVAPTGVLKTTVQVGDGSPFTGYVTYNAVSKSVSYSTTPPSYTCTVDGSSATWSVDGLTADNFAAANVTFTGSGTVAFDFDALSINVGAGVTLTVNSTTLTAPVTLSAETSTLRMGVTGTLSGNVSGSGVIEIADGVTSTVSSSVTLSHTGGTTIGANATLRFDNNIKLGTSKISGDATSTLLFENINNRSDMNYTNLGSWGLKTAATWQGTVEFKNSTCGLADPKNWGNASSTIRFNNVNSYLYSAQSAYTGKIEIASGGWNIQGDYSGPITFEMQNATWCGTGTLTISIYKANHDATILLPADASAFKGTVAFASGARARVVFGASNTSLAFENKDIIVESGAKVTIATGRSWSIGGALTVRSGAELTIDGALTLSKGQNSRFTVAVVETGGKISINSSGDILVNGEYSYGRFEIYGDLLVGDGGKFESLADMQIHNGGAAYVLGEGSLWLYYGMMDSANGNAGMITVPSVARLKTRRYTGSNVQYTKVKNTETGKVIFKPTNSSVTSESIGDFTDYVVIGSGSVEVDVTSPSLTLPTGTDSLTLFSTSTDLSDYISAGTISVTGNANYYLKQTDGAVTLQLYAARDSAGNYYEDADDAFDAIVDDNSLVVTILNGTEASHDSALAKKGLFRDGTQVKFLAAEVTNTTTPAVTPYANVQDAIDAANNTSIVSIYVASTVSSAQSPLFIKPIGITLADITIDYNNAGYAYVQPDTDMTNSGYPGVYMVQSQPIATTFTWKSDITTGNWWDKENWTSTKPVAAIPNNSLYNIVLGNNATIAARSYNVGSISVGANVSLVTQNNGEEITITVNDGVILTSESATLSTIYNGNTVVNLSKRPYTTLDGKGVVWSTENGATTYSVADATVIVDGVRYGNLSQAIGEAAVNGDTITLLADGSISSLAKTVTLDIGANTLTLTAADALDSITSLRGTGTLVLPAGTAPTSALATLLQNANWQGTVVVSGYSLAGDLPLASWGNNGSKIKLMGVDGKVVSQTVGAELVFENGTYDYALHIKGGYDAGQNTFSKISGSGTIKATGTFHQVFAINNSTGYTGSIDADGSAAGRLYFTAGRTGSFLAGRGTITIDDAQNGASSAKIGDGNFWKGGDGSWAATGNVAGIRILGTLEFVGSATLKASGTDGLRLYDGATLKFDDIGVANTPKYVTVSSGTKLTFASGTVKIAFGDGATLRDGAMLIDWSAATGVPPAGTFAFDDGEGGSTTTKSGEGAIYYLASESDGLYLRKAVATATTTGSVVSYHNTIASAVTAAGAGGTITVLDNLASVEVNHDQTVVVASEKVVGTLSWGAEYATETSVTGDGETKHVKSDNTAVDYYWTGATDSAWATTGNWKVNASDGPVATRAVTSIDSVVFNDGASVNHSAAETVAGIAVNGAVSVSGTSSLETAGDITGSGTLTISSGGLASVASGITVNPNVVFGDGTYIGCGTGGDAITFNGNVSLPAGTLYLWNAAHSFAGTTTLNGNFTKAGDRTLNVANVNVAANSTLSGSITITGTVSIDSGKTLTLPASGVTYSSATFAGSGKVALGALSGSQLLFDSGWTGTVVLPQVTNGQNFRFDYYGKEGSKIQIDNGFDGSFSSNNYQVKPWMVVNSLLTIKTSENKWYNFEKVSGTGNISIVQTGTAPAGVHLKNVTDYSGSISNTKSGGGTPTLLYVSQLHLSEAPASGQKLVSTSTPSTVTLPTDAANGVYVNGVQQTNISLVKKSDGIYVAAKSSTTGSGTDAVTTIETSSSDSAVEASVNVGDSYTGTIVVPANVTKLTTTGTAVADGKLKLKVNYGVDSTAIYENILTRDASGYISLTSDADAAVGGVKVTPEIKTGDAENPPMVMSGSAPAFSAKAIPGLWYAVKAASSEADLGDKFKYGTPVQATGDTVNIEAPTFPGTVTYYRLSAGMNQDDVTRYIVSTNRLAVQPTTDGLFAYGENSTTTTAAHDCYRIPAIASTWLPGDAGDPLQAIVMGIYDARTSYWDLGQRMNKTTNERQWNNNEHHFAGIDIAGNYSLDGGASWSAAQIMIDVPNAFDPATGEDNIDSTSGIDKAYDIGDPAIVYVPATEKFLMMGITGGGNSSVSNITANAMGADLVMYECTASSVANGAPNWQNVTGFTKEGVIALLKAKDDTLTFDYPPNGYSFDYDSTRAWTRETVYFLSILQGPGNALVTREDCGSIKAGTIVFPMQYCAKKRTTDGNHVGISYTFALYSTDNGATWNVTSVCKDEAAYGSECCIAQLDDGSLLMEVRPPNASTKRAFFRSTDFNTWTKACELVESAGPAEGSILRIGAKDGKSVYACSFTTGATRADLQLFIGTDYTSDEDVANVAKGINWTTTPFCTIWKGDTGTASTGAGVDTVVYGYSSLVMLDETTLGVLFEAHGHIYFTKIDVSSALK